jgi:hypothetical protein
MTRPGRVGGGWVKSLHQKRVSEPEGEGWGLLEIRKNGLPPLLGPGYNLRLPRAEEIAETHDHE